MLVFLGMKLNPMQSHNKLSHFVDKEILINISLPNTNTKIFPNQIKSSDLAWKYFDIDLAFVVEWPQDLCTLDLKHQI